MTLTIPYWTGCKKKFESNSIALPFDLSISPDKIITQKTSPETQLRIQNSYMKEDYKFITFPPGTSALTTCMSKSRMKYIKGIVGEFRDLNILEIGAGNDFLANEITSENTSITYTIVDPTIKTSQPHDSIKIIRSYFPIFW